MIDKNLIKLLGKDKKYLIYLVLLNIFALILNLGIAFTICYVIEISLQNKNNISFSLYYIPLVISIIILVLRFITYIVIGRCKAILGEKSKEHLRNEIFNKVMILGNRKNEDLSLASLTQVSIEGVEQLDLYYSEYLPQFFFAMMSPIFLFIIYCFINLYSAIALLIAVPLIPISIIAVSKYAKKIFATYWDEYTHMGDAFLDNISGMKELKIFNADEMYEKKMVDEAETFRKITMKVLTMQLASTTIMDLVAYGGAGIGISIALATTSQITFLSFSIPTLVLFLVLTGVDFFLPLRQLGSAFHISMNGATAGRKILRLLSLKEPNWGKETVDNDNIKIENLSFKYSDSNEYVLNNINLNIKSHSLTSIVGESGSGKSTLISLLSGFKKGYEGSIYYGNKELNSLSRDSLLKHISIISYDTFIFHDTIKNNFLLANKNITDEEILSYLKQVHLENIISKKENLDYIIEENAQNLSGGERQRLAFAIALASNKDIYFLDEATSNIDKESEEIIMNNVKELSKTKTVFMISHRLANVYFSDYIYVLKDGKIVEEGTNEELLKLNGVFNSLKSKQESLEKIKEVK